MMLVSRGCAARGLVVLCLAGCGRHAAPAPVLVGLVLTSGAPIGGEHARQGARLAAAEARVEGKTLSGRPFAVVHAESRGDLDLVGPEAVRLLTVNKVAALVAPAGAPAAERLLRAAQPYGVPVVLPGELPEAAAGPRVRALGAPPAARGRALARYAARDLKAARALVLTDARDRAAATLASAFVKEWPRGAGGGVEEWSASAADAANLAERARKAGPNLVLIAAAPADFRTLLSRLAEAGLRVPIVYGGEDAGTEVAEEGPAAGPEVYLATVYAPEKLTARGQEFARRYEAEYHEPPDLSAAGAYDATRLLFEVLARAQSAEPATLGDEGARTENFETVTGPVTWKDSAVRRAFFLVRVKGPRAEVVQTVEPGG
jgi:branched-chain amino acid transport system substrate-binding protein